MHRYLDCIHRKSSSARRKERKSQSVNVLSGIYSPASRTSSDKGGARGGTQGTLCRRSKSKKSVVLTGADKSARAVLLKTEGRAGRVSKNRMAHHGVDSA